MAKKEYQVRVANGEGEEFDVQCFTRKQDAVKVFRARVNTLHNSDYIKEDVHVELVEVLQHEHIEPTTNTSDDIIENPFD